MKDNSIKFRAWYIVFINALVGCAIASTFPQFSMTVANLAAKSGIAESVLLTSDTIKSCGIVAAMLISGFLYNRFGAKTVFVYSTIAAIIPQVLFPYLGHVWLLMIFKFMQGTSSMIFPVFLVIIMNWVEERNIGLSTAIFNGIFYSGGGIGGTIAGIVIANSSWEISYHVMALIQLVLAIVWLLTVKETPPEASGVPDVSHTSKAPNLSEQSNTPEAEPKPNLLLTPHVWLLAISFLATTWAVQAITVDLSIYSSHLGFGELEIGKILTAVTIGMIASCLVSGKASDFFAKRAKRKDISRILVLVFGYVLVVAAVIFMAFADTTNFTLLYTAALLLTFGASWGLGAFYCILPEIYDEKTVPIVTGITGGIGDAGMPVAPLVVGVVFGIRGMWVTGWMTCAVMAAISSLSAIILIMMLRKKKSHAI